MEKHNPQQVAQTLKELFRQNNIQLVLYAQENGVTSAQIYNVLNGREYISANWALKFNAAVGVSIFYCITGTLPVIDPEHRYATLLNAAREYKQAVDSEDTIRNESESLDDEIDDNVKLKFAMALNEARLNRIKLGVELEKAFLNGAGGHENGVAVEDENQNETMVEKLYKIEKTNDFKLNNFMNKKLHEAIEEVIRSAGRPLSCSEIANAINRGHLYSRKDGLAVPSSQISARVKNYPHLFDVNRETSPVTIDIKH